MLTEQEVSRSWNRLFQSGNITEDTLDQASQLLEKLRMESPLRHRLQTELEELRTIAAKRVTVAADDD